MFITPVRVSSLPSSGAVSHYITHLNLYGTSVIWIINLLGKREPCLTEVSAYRENKTLEPRKSESPGLSQPPRDPRVRGSVQGLSCSGENSQCDGEGWTRVEADRDVAARWWWCMPLIPALERQVHLSEFQASLAYRRSSRTARAVTQ